MQSLSRLRHAPQVHRGIVGDASASMWFSEGSVLRTYARLQDSLVCIGRRQYGNTHVKGMRCCLSLAIAVGGPGIMRRQAVRARKHSGSCISHVDGSSERRSQVKVRQKLPHTHTHASPCPQSLSISSHASEGLLSRILLNSPAALQTRTCTIRMAPEKA